MNQKNKRLSSIHSSWILIRIILLLSLIFTLSGCYLGPKTALDKTLVQNAPTAELEQILSYIETFDILEFTNLDPNDSMIFHGFEVDKYYHAYLVRNISLFLIEAEVYYNEKAELSHGELRFHITGQNILGANHTEILALSEELQNSSNHIGPRVRYGDFIAFHLNNSFQEDPEIIVDPSPQERDNAWEEAFHANWTWCVLAEFFFDVSDRFGGCAGYGFSELFLLDNDLSIQFLLAASEFPIC